MARSSTAAKARRKNKKEGEAGKRGNKGHFHGSRAAFISEYFPEFVVAKAAGRGAQKHFWDTFYGAWWRKFHWTLALTQDPDEDAVALAEPELTAEVLARKAEVIEQTQKVCINPVVYIYFYSDHS